MKFRESVGSARRFAARLKDHKRFDIASHHLVLDMGSGQDPHPRANILCDKFVIDASERSCGAGLLIDRPLVLADATATPFPDGAFDFIFCSHLLEHMHDPAALLKELMRVGRRGYIETPSKVYEKVYGWDFHNWYVSVEGGVLVLERKEQAIHDQQMHDWFQSLLDDRGASRLLLDNLHELGLLTTFLWGGDIPYRIDGPSGVPVAGSSSASELMAQVDHAMTMSQKVKGTVAARTRRSSDGRAAKLLEEMNCPSCDTQLDHRGDGRVCSSCMVLYPINGLVHVALKELARPLETNG